MSLRSVNRALSVFDCFTPTNQRISLHEISETINLAKSTTFRILQTLIDAGYMIQTDSVHYSLSLRVLRLGNCILPNFGVQEIARPEMYLVNKATDETVALSEFLPNERVIIDVVESTLPLKFVLRAGESVQQDEGATGQIFLAYHSDSLRAYLKKHKKKREQVQKQIDAIQTKGYAFMINSRALGSCGIAVAVFDINNECKYSLGVYGPDKRIESNLEMIVQTLKVSANRISVRLGSTTLIE